MVYLQPKQSLGYQQHSFRSLLLYTHIQVVIYMAQSPCSLLPLADSPCFNFPLPNPPSPLLYPSTYLAPSSCDRNVHLRPRLVINWPTLTHLDPPLSQPTPSLQIPRTPTAQRLTRTTSGIFRLLLSGTDIPHLPPPPVPAPGWPRGGGVSTQVYCPVHAPPPPPPGPVGANCTHVHPLYLAQTMSPKYK